MPEIAELRLALESGDVSQLIQLDKTKQTLASSLITIPTYIKDASKLPEDVLSMLVHNKKTYHYIVEKFPESLIAQSINELEDEESNDGIYNENNEKHRNEEESAGVKLKKRMSSLLKGQKPILKKRENDSTHQDSEKPLLEETYVSLPSSYKGQTIAED